jgi:hypothetical protein
MLDSWGMGRVGPWYLVLKLRLVPRCIATHQFREADPPPPPHSASTRLTGSRPGFCSHAVLQFDEAGDLGWKRMGMLRAQSKDPSHKSDTLGLAASTKENCVPPPPSPGLRGLQG